MRLVAERIYSYGLQAWELDKPVVDQTGLNGTSDFTVDYALGDNKMQVIGHLERGASGAASLVSSVP
jgi:hypothetical protein